MRYALLAALMLGCIAEDAPEVVPDRGAIDRGIPDDGPPVPDRGVPLDDPPPDDPPPDDPPPDDPRPDDPMACSEPPPPLHCEDLHPTEVPPALGCAPDPELQIVGGPDDELGEIPLGPVAGRFALEGFVDGPVRWRLEGLVPPGIGINACSGALTGTLNWPQEGEVSVVATVGDGERCRFTRAPLALPIFACAILIEPDDYALPEATAHADYRAQLRIWDSDGGFGGAGRWRVEGALPPGLSLDCETGEISGEPSEPGDYQFQVSWVEFECGGVTSTDTVRLTVVEADPCAACGDGELCVVFSDGQCNADRPRCVPDPANCAVEGCTQRCLLDVCNAGEEQPFWTCDPEQRCEGPPFFNCYGP